MEISFIPTSMYVYPVPRQSVQGRGEHSIVLPDGSKRPAGRTFARGASKDYCFPLSPDGMRIDTGLDEKIDNPFINKELADKHIKDYWIGDKERLLKEETITKQTYLEIMHNRPKGTYSSEKKVVRPFDVEAKEASFLEQYRTGLIDGTNVFVAGNPDHEISMQLLKRSPSIANSKQEMNPSIHHFYIGQENEAKEEVASKRQKFGKAVAALFSIKAKHSEFELMQLATVLRLVIGTVTPVSVNEKLDDYIFKEDKNQSARIDTFTETTKDFGKKEGMERMYLRYVFQSAINTQVISIVNGSFIWRSKKGIQNLYNLGTKEGSILNMFYVEMTKYTGAKDEDNFYGDLINELKSKGVKLEE